MSSSNKYIEDQCSKGTFDIIQNYVQTHTEKHNIVEKIYENCKKTEGENACDKYKKAKDQEEYTKKSWTDYMNDRKDFCDNINKHV